jgi:acyl-CoA thioesterase
VSATESEKELARQAAEAMYATDVASRRVGIEIIDVAPGRAQARMAIQPWMANGHGVAHGGYLFMLADTAFALACNTSGRPTVARACEIVFLRPVRVDEKLTAKAVELTRSGRSGIYDVSVRDADGIRVAELRGQSAELKRSTRACRSNG